MSYNLFHWQICRPDDNIMHDQIRFLFNLSPRQTALGLTWSFSSVHFSRLIQRKLTNTHTHAHTNIRTIPGDLSQAGKIFDEMRGVGGRPREGRIV